MIYFERVDTAQTRTHTRRVRVSRKVVFMFVCCALCGCATMATHTRMFSSFPPDYVCVCFTYSEN